jgi:hypothetical protein
MGAHHNTLVNFLIMYQLMTTATLVQQVFGVFDSSVTYNSGESCFQPSVPVVKVPRHHNPGQNGKIHDQVGTAADAEKRGQIACDARPKDSHRGPCPKQPPKDPGQPAPIPPHNTEEMAQRYKSTQRAKCPLKERH